MAKKILGALGALVVLLLIVVATRPSTYRVERSTTIGASPVVVFAHIADFHQWNEWSPWDALDPKMERTFEGPTEGVGAKYSWSGNDQVGKGSMTVTKQEPQKELEIALHFISPMESDATTGFQLAPEGEGTKITWSMDGTNGFMGKAVSMVMDMDSMIGTKYEEGLAKLKTVAEKNAREMAEAAKIAAAAAAVVEAGAGAEGGDAAAGQPAPMGAAAAHP